MFSTHISHKVIVFGAVGMIVVGLFLMAQAVSAWPGRSSGVVATETTAITPTSVASAEVTAHSTPATSSTSVDSPEPTVTPSLSVLTVSLDDSVPETLRAALDSVQVDGMSIVTTTAAAPVRFDAEPAPGAQAVYAVTFVASTRFDTIDPSISWAALRALWSGAPISEPISETVQLSDATSPFTAVAVLTETLPLLTQVLGAPSPGVVGYADMPSLVDAAWRDRTTLAITPFDQLEPRLVVLAIDGQNPIENSAHFDPADYPLVASIYAHIEPVDADETARAAQLLAA
ncbi:MAG: hypothetical protein R6W76_22215, partial [Caldilinea sp.]